MGIVFTIAWGGMVLAPPVFGSMVDAEGYGSAWFMLTVLMGISFLGFAVIGIRQRRVGAN
jgi:hypothetical protein